MKKVSYLLFLKNFNFKTNTNIFIVHSFLNINIMAFIYKNNIFLYV